jgi:hypothetical protein
MLRVDGNDYATKRGAIAAGAAQASAHCRPVAGVQPDFP